jgi:hypothetical protein
MAMNCRVTAKTLRAEILCLWFCLCVAAAGADQKFIRLRNETIVTPAPAAAVLQPQAVERPVSGLFLVQFQDHPQTEWRQTLESLGVHPLRFVPEDACVVRVNQQLLSTLKRLPGVRWVGEYRPEHKLHQALKAALTDSTGTNTPQVRVLLTPDATTQDAAAVRAQMRDFHGTSRLRFGAILTGSVPATQLNNLIQSQAVLWVEPIAHPKLYDEVATKIVAGESTDGGHPAYVHELGYNGKGVAVAVADSGLDSGDVTSMHPDIAGRVDALFFYGGLTDASDEHSHGTHCAGIIAGNGATGETDENGALYGLGVAPGAHLIAQRIFDGSGNFFAPPSNEALTHDAKRAGAVVGSNSWGDDTQGRYDLNASEFDALVRDADADTQGDQQYILEFSNGNAGPGAQTVGSPAVAKNVIATGASENDRTDLYIYTDGPEVMADFSSRGPCEDGRIKPDVVAPGTWISSLQSSAATDQYAWMGISPNYQYQGGTSQAGPHVSGAAAVFVQYYRDTHTNAIPSPALVKAALINSAVSLDESFGNSPVPNMDEGWGRVDLTGIIGSDRSHDFLDQTVLLTTGQVYEHRIVVGTIDEPLKITLVYTDVPGLPAAIPALVNDLDLEVTGPDGTVYRGNQFQDGESVPDAATSDNINNVEAVHLAHPQVGEYLVRVNARNVVEDARVDTTAIDQDFALVVSGDLPLPGVGLIAFNRSAYTVPSTIQLRVIDYDLSGQPSVPVKLHSSSQTNDMVLTLLASGVNGVFTGRVDTASLPVSADGRLHIAQGDVIEAVYEDASPEAIRVTTATADLQPPVISGVGYTNQFGRTTISWITDEPATSLVYYGTNTPLGFSNSSSSMTQNHQVLLSNLMVGSTNWFYVVSTDAAGNTSINNNNGAYYSFVVPPAAVVLLVNDYLEDGWTDVIPVSNFTEALDQTGISYEVWDVATEGRSPNINELRAFRAVLWRINDSFWSDTTLDVSQQSALETYLNGGGSLFIASMELLSRLNGGSTPTSAFMTNVLQVQSFAEDVMVPSVNGIEQDPVTAGMSINLDYSIYPSFDLADLGPDVSDTISPTTNAAPIFLDGASGEIAGLRFPRTGQDSTGRVVFLSFPLDAISMTDPAPNNRVNLLRNILSFLVPGVNGIASIALDSPAYTLPSKVMVEVADSDFAGQPSLSVQLHSTTTTNGIPLILTETSRSGLFRGSITLVSATNAPTANILRANNGDTVWAEYFDASGNILIRSSALVDTVAPSISAVTVDPDYQEATFTWDTSKETDALIQFGESTFLGRTAYSTELTSSHELTIYGLVPDRLYYYQVVSRDAAGNTAVDDNLGRLYTFRTLSPRFPPWTDSMDTGGDDWTVLIDENGYSQTTWTLGVPNNGIETEAHSPPNAWGSCLNGAIIDTADAYLISPAIELTGGNIATLSFWQSYDFSVLSDMDIYEYGQIHVTTNNGASWIQLVEYSDDSSGGWQQEELDLTPYIGQVVNVAFYYGLLSFDEFSRPGWLVDDFSVTVTNTALGEISITNNLAQAGFDLSGPISTSGHGMSQVLTNAPVGEYVVNYKPVAFYDTPASQTNTLAVGQKLLIQGNYTFVDENQNGIPDAWETQYFGSVQASHPGDLDTDGDGQSDLAEFLAGTNPTNALSNFHFNLPARETNGAVGLTWTTAPGRAYLLESSTNGLDWTPRMDWTRSDGEAMIQTVPAETPDSSELFRLKVHP